MKTLEGFRHREFAALVALAAAGALLAPACGGDDNPEPTTPVITGGTGGSGGGSGGKGNGSSAEGGGANEAGSAEGGESTGTGGKGGSGGRNGKGGSGNGNEGGEDNGSGATGGTGNTGNTGNQGGEGGGGEEIDCSVRGPNDCYRCTPQAISPAPEFPHSENEQFLNHCDDSQGSAFPNAERIPGFTGTLPELP